MAAGNLPVQISDKAGEALVQYAKRALELLHNQWSIRNQLENVDKYYMREGNWDEQDRKARIANRQGDKRRFRDVTVPIVMPQVESAVGYMLNVFLTQYPVFGVASDPLYEDAAVQLETVLANNCRQAKWIRQLILFFRDGLKYNLHALEVSWDQITTYAIEASAAALEGKQKQVIWQGNTLRRMDMYNTIFDPRVQPAEVHEKGEFAGYIELLSRVQMKRLINDLFGRVPPKVALQAFESGFSGASTGSQWMRYYIPQINPEALRQRSIATGFDWMSWVQASGTKQSIQYRNMYEILRLYARIIPSDFGLNVPQPNTPQVWKMIIVNGQVPLYFERVTNAHGYLPMVFGQPLEDGLNFQTKSFAQNVMDLQDTASAFWNANMASKRRLVTDRVLYDPSRIRAADINSDNPSAKIPIRPAAYGKPLNEAVYQFPYRDELSATLVQHSDLVVKMANLVNGQNQSQQGQFTKGNKTPREYQDVMQHSNTKNQTLAIMTEQQVFSVVKEMLLLNTLQYQTETYLYNNELKKQVKIDPLALRKAVLEFEVSDGLTAKDKLMKTDEFTGSLQVLGSSPQIQQGYRIAPLFSYVMKLRGVDLTPFEKTQPELQYEQALGAWQQAAALAAQKGAAFSTPMPQPPDQAAIQAEKQRQQDLRSGSVLSMLQTLGISSAQQTIPPTAGGASPAQAAPTIPAGAGGVGVPT